MPSSLRSPVKMLLASLLYYNRLCGLVAHAWVEIWGFCTLLDVLVERGEGYKREWSALIFFVPQAFFPPEQLSLLLWSCCIICSSSILDILPLTTYTCRGAATKSKLHLITSWEAVAQSWLTDVSSEAAAYRQQNGTRGVSDGCQESSFYINLICSLIFTLYLHSSKFLLITVTGVFVCPVASGEEGMMMHEGPQECSCSIIAGYQSKEFSWVTTVLLAKLISFLGRRLFVRISVNQEYLLNVGTDPTPTELN